MIKEQFSVYTGTRRWTSPPEIRPSKKGRAEWGAGIYGTNKYETAAKYAKGGGKVMLLKLEPGLVLEKTALPLDTVKEIIQSLVPRALRAEFTELVEENSARMKNREDRFHKIPELDYSSGWLPADIIRNLMVNEDLSHGKRGAELSMKFAELGISYSTDSASLSKNESWIVIFDTSKISSVTHFPSSQITYGENDTLPRPIDLISNPSVSASGVEPGL